MQITTKQLSDTKTQITISVEQKEINKAKQAVLKELAKTVKVTGFRSGTAPMAMVEKQVDDQRLQSEVLQQVVNDSYVQVVDKEGIRTLGTPEIKISKFVPYTELSFVAEVDVMPKVTLGDYKKIKKDAPKVTVTAKDVTDVLENLQKRSAGKKPVSRVAKDGDELNIDFDGKDAKGKAVAGASGKDYPLTLGSSSFIPGFEEGLVGAKAGDKKELKLTFPKEYHAKQLAGTKITFDVTVKEVRAQELPKLDDKFAASVGPFKKLDELKADIKQQLAEQKKLEAENKLKDEIVEELVKKSKFSLPDVLVADQLTMLEQDFNQNLVYRGITQKEYIEQEGFKDADEWREKELKPQAERRVSVGIVLAEVAEKEDLKVSNEELQARIQLYKQQYAQQSAQFDQPDMQREVASRLLTEKTVDTLYTLATKSK